MTRRLDESYLNDLTKNMLNNKNVYGAIFCVENSDASLSWLGSAGDIDKGDRYYIASVTKLYITAILLMLREEKRLSFKDKISKHLPEELVKGIHVLDGKDYNNEITIAHLMSNTSGIPDYFYYDKQAGESAEDLLLGNDQSWSLERAIG